MELQPIVRHELQQVVAMPPPPSTWKKLHTLGQRVLRGVAELFARMNACARELAAVPGAYPRGPRFNRLPA
jgi:hypothetical protein